MNERIEINPDALMGKPVVRGARIPVAPILRKLSIKGEGLCGLWAPATFGDFI